MTTDPGARAREFLHPLILSALLVLLTAAALWPVLGNGFVYDDRLYILDNPEVRKGITLEGMRWAFTSTWAANWHPLAWISHMADVECFGLDPAGHHVVSLFLHAANAALLFLLLRAMTGAAARSAFVAALFAVHPLHVESAAWIAERKDVLSTFLGLVALGAYLRYARKPGPWRYLAVAAAFTLGLAAKPMLVTLPLLMLLLDAWPLGRFGAAGPSSTVSRAMPVVEKLPLLALSLFSGGMTLYAQRAGGALESFAELTLSSRIANAALSCAAYLWKTVLPVDLAFFYPFPVDPYPAVKVVACGALLALFTGAALVLRRSRPYLAAGWFWFLAGLLPVIGLVQAGSQAMADRYTYLPLIGIFIIVAWGAADLAGRRKAWRMAAAAAGVVLIVILAFLSRQQTAYWKDDKALYFHALRVTRDNWKAHNNLGTVLYLEGDLAGAERHYREALRIRPYYGVARRNLQNMGVRLDFSSD